MVGNENERGKKIKVKQTCEMTSLKTDMRKETCRVTKEGSSIQTKHDLTDAK